MSEEVSDYQPTRAEQILAKKVVDALSEKTGVMITPDCEYYPSGWVTWSDGPKVAHFWLGNLYEEPPFFQAVDDFNADYEEDHIEIGTCGSGCSLQVIMYESTPEPVS